MRADAPTGDDLLWLRLPSVQDIGELGNRLFIRPEQVPGHRRLILLPDFEKPGDANKDNVYEVTLVVTDSLGKTGTYNVTVKVINSTEDNKAGKVTILNRQPEVATALETTFDDPDKPTREVKYQWYRLATNGQDPDNQM